MAGVPPTPPPWAPPRGGVIIRRGGCPLSMNTHRAPLLAAIAVLGIAMPAVAHHSIALYDTDHLTTLKGKVTRIEWTSPHVFVYFDAKEADGAHAEWSMEL